MKEERGFSQAKNEKGAMYERSVGRQDDQAK